MPEKKTSTKATPAKKAAAKKAASTAASPATKKLAKKTAEKILSEKGAPKKPVKPHPTHDQIAKAAYLNYRSRTEQNFPGDNEGDWLEAVRTLTNP